MPSDVTGKTRTMAEAPAKIAGDVLKDHPLKALASLVVVLTGLYGGVQFGLGRLEAMAADNAETRKVADSAIVAASQTKAAVDQINENTQLLVKALISQGRVVVDTVVVKVPVVVNGMDTIAVDTAATRPR